MLSLCHDLGHALKFTFYLTLNVVGKNKSNVVHLIDNNIRHHSGQNLSWTHSAAPRGFTF